MSENPWGPCYGKFSYMHAVCFSDGFENAYGNLKAFAFNVFAASKNGLRGSPLCVMSKQNYSALFYDISPVNAIHFNFSHKILFFSWFWIQRFCRFPWQRFTFDIDSSVFYFHFKDSDWR